ncbi:hypothetical protein COCC4DRAFT_29763 [Bipolaris maydis ATCC 48331]|uniref:Uncharacterized protein n=2 Tax=Cochliobolus heterostrophus TaxID=5016 RepID=M2UPV3_COCH5|nr:uncharacterized protein COCC4DRAFT_29763 [Bipolaris maydis ATCC 48331]EMD89907.1 hypothetical protein COCHEDRAFT_1022079 [Bipolaris maydis C5]ENI09881.1 hypothetical protein COCC4DRAFT_29763 [Bipolaris maydis ATCC 48331]
MKGRIKACCIAKTIDWTGRRAPQQDKQSGLIVPWRRERLGRLAGDDSLRTFVR